MGLRLCLAYLFGFCSMGRAFAAGVAIFSPSQVVTGLVLSAICVAIAVTLAFAGGRIRRY